jgi:hypothetical protein
MDPDVAATDPIDGEAVSLEGPSPSNNPEVSPVSATEAEAKMGTIAAIESDDEEAESSNVSFENASTNSLVTATEVEAPMEDKATMTPAPVLESFSTMFPDYLKDAPQMQWNDRFDLVDVIILLDPEHEEDVDWYAVAGMMKQPWPVRTMQTTVMQLLDLVEDQGTFTGTLAAVRVFMTQQMNSQEQKSDYGPEQEKADEVMEEGVANKQPAIAKTPKSERRKVIARKSVPRSPASPRDQKARVYSKLAPPQSFRSTENVSDSDDTDSVFSV